MADKYTSSGVTTQWDKEARKIKEETNQAALRYGLVSADPPTEKPEDAKTSVTSPGAKT